MEPQWEHLTTYDSDDDLDRTLKIWEQGGWQLCTAIRYDDKKLRLLFKRSTDVPTRGEGDQAFQELIEHHRQHHLLDNPDGMILREKEDWQALVSEIEELKLIRSRANKELERIKPGGAVWQALRYVLDIN